MLNAPLTDIDTARGIGASRPWRVRLVWDGPNADNASGESSKYWQATHDGSGQVELRWGSLGSKGQSKRGVGISSALTKARSKLRSRSRSYILDLPTAAQRAATAAGGRTVAKAPRRPSAPVLRAKQMPGLTLDGLLDMTALRGLILIDNGIDLSGRIPGLPVGNLYIDRHGKMWLIVRGQSPESMFLPFRLPPLS